MSARPDVRSKQDESRDNASSLPVNAPIIAARYASALKNPRLQEPLRDFLSCSAQVHGVTGIALSLKRQATAPATLRVYIVTDLRPVFDGTDSSSGMTGAIEELFVSMCRRVRLVERPGKLTAVLNYVHGPDEIPESVEEDLLARPLHTLSWTQVTPTGYPSRAPVLYPTRCK